MVLSAERETGSARPAARSQEARRSQLIDAAITAIAEAGLSRTTLAKVAGIAGLTAGMVNFHFTSKEALLTATLQHLADDFEAALDAAVAAAGPDPVEALEALIETHFDPAHLEPRKVAVWYAFIGEARARADYMRICGARDAAQLEAFRTLCRQIVEQDGRPLDAEAVSRALVGLLETLWQDLLFDPSGFDRDAAKATCRAYLASLFPGRFAMPEKVSPCRTTSAEPAAEEAAPLTLPAWVYDNEEFFDLEREALFLPAWHIVCHVSELPEPGSYVTFELLGERAFVVRGKDGAVRAFHNVCRHRAHAVVAGEAGRCPGVLQCPYHGWTYELDGSLKAVSQERTFAKLDKAALGLEPIEHEVFQGFVFIRFRAGGPGVAERLAPYAAELAHHRIGDMEPVEGLWLEETDVDWKNVWDNYLEGYHFATGHPGLSDLMGQSYDYETAPGQVARLSHRFRAKPSKTWSARHYRKLLPDCAHLPEELRQTWSYFFLFPAVAFDLYPDKMDFFQILPTGPGQCTLRSRSYALPDERREMRAARYLNLRLNIAVQNEDNELTRSVQQGLASSSYTAGVVSEVETILHGFQDWVRAALPVATLGTAPPPGNVAARNRALASSAEG